MIKRWLISVLLPVPVVVGGGAGVVDYEVGGGAGVVDSEI